MLNRLGFVALTMKFRTWPLSPGPSLMFVAQPETVSGPEFSRTVSSGPAVKLGAWLTPFTVIVNVWLLLVS